MKLFDPKKHYKLKNLTWDESKVRSYIEAIFRSTENSFQNEKLWDAHSNDIYSEHQKGPFLDLYMGAAGVIWAQKHLSERGYGEIKHQYGPYIKLAQKLQYKNIKKALKGFNCNNIDEYKAGLFLGDLGFLISELKLQPKKESFKRLINLTKKNTKNTICDYMWGSPGVTTALLAYKEHFSPSEINEVISESICFLKKTLTHSDKLNSKLWQQNLYGSSSNYLGAVHGFAGNAFSIIKAFDFISDKKYWSDFFKDFIKKTAVTNGDFTNWRKGVDQSTHGGSDLLVQFCHGAPGIICCLSRLIDGTDPEFDNLMIQGGNLTFEAGPLMKGANLCHGTSGNGFAFLKLFTATKDQLWLDRARALAMFAIEQSKKEAQTTGQQRFSLWTGESGLAIFLDACLNETSDIPTMDFF